MKILKEVREKDDLYFAGPFWLIGNSLEDINRGNFSILSEKFLVDYNGQPTVKNNPEVCTHKHIWNSKYKDNYSVEYNYYPRGRIVFQRGKLYLNIPEGLNVSAIKDALLKEFDYNRDFDNVFYKDPTTGGHYSFQLK